MLQDLYIHLYGDVNVFLYIGEEYDEKGYDVIDSVDGAKLKDQVKQKAKNMVKQALKKVLSAIGKAIERYTQSNSHVVRAN